MTADKDALLREALDWIRPIAPDGQAKQSLVSRITAALAEKPVTEAAGRPEPVAWLLQGKNGHVLSFSKPKIIGSAVLEPLYGHDLLTYADRMESAYKMAHQQAMENGEKRLVAERQLAELQAKHDALVKDAERYRWLRDRMQVRHKKSISGKTKEALSMRIGFSFLDTTTDPYKGWTDIKYFDEQRNKLDTAIDAAMSAVALREGEE